MLRYGQDMGMGMEEDGRDKFQKNLNKNCL